MATLTINTITIAGVAEAAVSADAGGDEFVNTGREFVKVSNGGGSPITVTPTVEGSLSTGETISPTVVTIPAGEERIIGPFPVPVYTDTTTLRAAIAYSGVTSVTVEAFKLPAATSNPSVSR